MAKEIVTDEEIVLVIKDLKGQGREEFVEFMRERRKLTKEYGHAQAEVMLKEKHGDKIEKVKAKKAK